MMLLSAANVASRCASCGDAAKRRRGGEGERVCPPFVGDEAAGEEAAQLLVESEAIEMARLTLVALLSRLVNDCRVL